MSLSKLLDVLDRAHNGPVVSLKDWDSRVIPTKIAKKLKEHGLNNTCNRKDPVNTDDALADEFFNAGFELEIGKGPDKVVFKHSKPEDVQKPVISCPLSIEVSEELWIPLLTGILQD